MIRDRGAIRRQFVDIIDLAPTILDAVGSEFRDSIGGRRQLPVGGRSIYQTFRSADAPSARETQYFELRGNRAITHGDWKAVSVHVPGTDFESDEWMLFHVAEDFSESTDLAQQMPDKLKELTTLWTAEAEKYSSPLLRETPPSLRDLRVYDDAYPPGRP
jgi:arylsulfatase A-like enzyme